MTALDPWADIAQSIRFRLIKAGESEIEPAHWRRAGFARPYHVLLHIRRGGFRIGLAGMPEPLAVGAGDCVFIPVGAWRQYVAAADHSTTLVNFCSFHCHVFNQLDFLAFFTIPTILTGPGRDELKQLVNQLAARTANCQESLLSAIGQRADGLCLLSSLLAAATAKPQFQQVQDMGSRLAGVFEFLAANWQRQVTLQELATIACLSVSALHRSFKAMTGMSPLGFVREQRINEAKRLLASSDASLARIAATLGYCDQFAFSKSFKKVCGQNPKTYRRNTRQLGIDF